MIDWPTERSEWSASSTMVGRGTSASEAASCCEDGCDRRARLRGREDERGGGREARSTPTR
eukprot:2894577-Prymnesium_polylepis.1